MQVVYIWVMANLTTNAVDPILYPVNICCYILLLLSLSLLLLILLLILHHKVGERECHLLILYINVSLIWKKNFPLWHTYGKTWNYGLSNCYSSTTEKLSLHQSNINMLSCNIRLFLFFMKSLLRLYKKKSTEKYHPEIWAWLFQDNSRLIKINQLLLERLLTSLTIF